MLLQSPRNAWPIFSWASHCSISVTCAAHCCWCTCKWVSLYTLLRTTAAQQTVLPFSSPVHQWLPQASNLLHRRSGQTRGGSKWSSWFSSWRILPEEWGSDTECECMFVWVCRCSEQPSLRRDNRKIECLERRLTVVQSELTLAGTVTVSWWADWAVRIMLQTIYEGNSCFSTDNTYQHQQLASQHNMHNVNGSGNHKENIFASLLHLI